MKKTLLIIALSIGVAACGSQSGKTDASAQSTAGGQFKGEGLMASSDCNTCHKPDVKLVGPSFKDIANKYSDGDIDKLADKVMQGGSGSWGDVPMAAHPAISKEDAKEMVKFILSHK